MKNTKMLKETTAWDIPSYTYIISTQYGKTKDKLLGYIKPSGEKIMFNVPMRFSTRYRTFVEIK
jgi:hypothetical protein